MLVPRRSPIGTTRHSKSVVSLSEVNPVNISKRFVERPVATALLTLGVVLVGTYTSVFIASPILIYLGVGTGRDALSAPDRDK